MYPKLVGHANSYLFARREPLHIRNGGQKADSSSITQAVACDDETRKRLIELHEKIATTGMPCLFFCKADCSRLGSALESSSEGGVGYLWSIVIMKAGRKQAG